MSRARGVARLLGLGVKTAGWVGAVRAHQRFVDESERYELFQRYMKRWARSLVHSTGGRVELTPESVYVNRRQFLSAMGIGAAGLIAGEGRLAQEGLSLKVERAVKRLKPVTPKG